MSVESFRNAVALLLDRPAIAENLDLGDGAAYTMLPPSNTAWFDKERAEALATPFDESLEKRLEDAINLAN